MAGGKTFSEVTSAAAAAVVRAAAEVGPSRPAPTSVGDTGARSVRGGAGAARRPRPRRDPAPRPAGCTGSSRKRKIADVRSRRTSLVCDRADSSPSSGALVTASGRVVDRGRNARDPGRRLAGVRPHAGQQPRLAADRDHAGERLASSSASTTSTSRRSIPDIRRGQQSYPLAIDGRLYVTTNDDNVFALDGATGKVIWQYKPPNSGMFKNFGIVANRGLAYCDGRLFISQLDMKLVALRPSRRQGPRDDGARPGRAERELELRLLRDERADLRQQPRDRRRRRLRVRDPRFRDGVHDRPEAGLAERRSGRFRPTSSRGGARRGSSAAAPSGRRPLSTRRRTRCTSGPARRRRSTSRACGRARTRGPTR